MANLTTEDVLKLARLSRLRLSKDEVETFKKEINEILSYVEILKNVDTDGLNPTSQVTGLENVMRKDVITDYSLSRDKLLKNVPASENGYVKTKRILG